MYIKCMVNIAFSAFVFFVYYYADLSVIWTDMSSPEHYLDCVYIHAIDSLPLFSFLFMFIVFLLLHFT